MSIKKYVGLALSLTLGLALTALTGTPARAQSTDLKEITVVLPNPSAINVFSLWTAIGEGYFADEGLKVNVEAVDGSSQVLQAMSAGQADIGEPGPGPLLGARARGLDAVFLYNLNPNSSFGIVVKQDSSYQTPADLKGKVVGVGTADGAEVSFARTVLDGSGMVEGQDYTFLPVGDGGPATAAFLRGDIEAYAASTSDAAILNSRGMHVRNITPAEYNTYFANGYAVLRSYIEENRDVIEKFGRALVRGVVFSMDPANTDKVLEHTTAGNPQEGEDPEFAKALLEAIRTRNTPPDLSNGWGYQNPEHWQAWHDSLLASGALKEPMSDLEAAYSNEFIETWNSVVPK
jgi:NitT/TauT family transport system substrate-binding protein